jgi:poly-gamma-glutamate synthesis protein (capsule biosynthesis protein)
MGHDVNYRMNDYHDIYKAVLPLLSGADIAVANLELPVDPTRPEAGYPYFNGNAAYVRAAVDAGFRVFSLANNHAFDGGAEGVMQTMRTLEALSASAAGPLVYSGIRGNPHRPFLPEAFVVQGVRIGFIALSQFLNEPDGGRYVDVIDYTSVLAVEEFLSFVREASRQFDLLIVSYHGDQEYVQEPSLLKKAFFRRLLDAGVHIVFGQHPHVVQGYEVLHTAGADRLIMFSMGNFISAMSWGMDPTTADEAWLATGEGYLLSVEIQCSSAGCSVARVEPIPIANYRNERGEMVVGLMKDLASGVVEVSAPWRSFYARRLDRMLHFLGASPAAAE